MYPVAVLAGGLGTRMARRTGPTLHKALLEVAGRPFIDFKLGQLAEQGVSEVVLLVGHGGEALARHAGDGRRYGLSVTSLADGDILLGTGGAVRRALAKLGEVFWVTYGDTLLSVPMEDVEAAFRASGRAGLMTVLANHDVGDRSNVALAGGLVTEYRKGAPAGTYRYIDYGMSLLTARALAPFPEGKAFDLAEVLRLLVDSAELAAYVVRERFYEIGSEAGYAETDAHLRSRATMAPGAGRLSPEPGWGWEPGRDAGQPPDRPPGH